MMRRVAMILLSIGIVALIAVLIMGISGGRYRAVDRHWPDSAYAAPQQIAAYDFPAEQVSSLQFDVAWEDISVLPGDGGVIHVEQWCDRALSEQDQLQCSVQNGVLLAQTKGRRGSGGFFGWTVPHAQITVQVPADALMPLSASAGAGDLEIRGVKLGHLDLSTGAGNIRLEKLEADESVLQTSAGDILVQDETKLTSLRGASSVGSVDVTAQVGGQVSLETESGDVAFTGSCGTFAASAAAGNVFGDIRQAQTVQADSSLGDVELLIPGTSRLESVHAQTAAGDVAVGLPSGSRISLEHSTSLGDLRLEDGAEFEITGQDAIRVDVSTSAGDIYLRGI